MKGTVNRAAASSAAPDNRYCAISTVYGLAEVQKIKPNHHSLIGRRNGEKADRPTSNQPVGAASS